MTPKVSVIMPVYNGAKYLKEAIESVLAQTYTFFEFVIINDGSNDDSENVIKSFMDERIKYVKNEHMGLIDSLNLGIKKSTGEFIARFDADDICEPNRLEEQIKFFKNNPEKMLVGSWATVINEDGIKTGELKYPPLDWQKIKKYSLLHNPLIHPTVMFKKALIDAAGDYNKKFKHIEDYELWTRIIYKYPCANISLPLIKYRVHNNQITKKKNIKMRLWGIIVRILALGRFIFRS
jgi:glycosyltransferase involved in cell wall biosynthesis